ncbi:hypothetical protein [Shewanella ulleungensis]|uniref:hypothetical protein n=1 Tax=Shewanella ulleungensis TaxID=2282699 RepID=UPI003D7A570E
MFDILTEPDLLRVGISAPVKELDEVDIFIQLHLLSKASIVEARLDLLLVCGASVQQREFLLETTGSIGCIVVFIDNPFNDTSAILNVMLNVKGKLDSNQMPNNIDIADIKNLADQADYLLAFDSFAALQDFFDSAILDRFVGAIHLSHDNTDLETYEKQNQSIGKFLSSYAYFTSSVYLNGKAQCTVLLGMQSIIIEPQSQ